MTAHVSHSASISDRLKAHWQDFRHSKAGHRFQDRYQRRRKHGHNPLLKALYLGAGLVLFIAGLILMPAPGPGILVVCFGAGLIAEESLAAARALDWLEIRARRVASRAQRAWKRASSAQKGLVVLAGLVIASAAALAFCAVVFD